MGKSGKKKRTHAKALSTDDLSVPRSFVFHRGEVGSSIMQLINDMRHVMEPYTAVRLKVRRANVMKDFVNVAGPLGISHIVAFSKTDVAPYVKFCRLPRGPTLTFKVTEYTLMRDVVATQKRPKTVGSQFKHPPLLVLNSFPSEGLHMKLTTTMFQNMYPAIKIQKVKLAEIRRCVLFNYDAESDSISFRHYNIEAVPLGVSCGVKKLLRNRLPNLGTLDDISDFMTSAAYMSESEGEEPTESHVQLPQTVPGKGNLKSAQSAIKLVELGPRLKLELIKVEEGVCEGAVLYHKYVHKSPAEIEMLKAKKAKQWKDKEKRKAEQLRNVERKKKEKDLHKEKSLAGMKRTSDSVAQTSDDDQHLPSNSEDVTEESPPPPKKFRLSGRSPNDSANSASRSAKRKEVRSGGSVKRRAFIRGATFVKRPPRLGGSKAIKKKKRSSLT